MSDPTLLIIGMFCFGVTFLGIVMTVQEFKKSAATLQNK